MTQSERAELEKWIEIITERAVEMGLDCYPTHFEVVPDHIIYELGSYSLPARFSHWTFGRDYHRQKTSYEYGMSKIYEIVFNTDPCQAFLFDSNSMLSHKLVVAHVLGHNDFFKNNIYFEHTDRRMIEKVRLHGNRIRRYQDEYGEMAVEEFLDAVLSIEEHFDISQTAPFRRKPQVKTNEKQPVERTPTTEYDDLWDMMDKAEPVRPAPNQKFPTEPDKDLLGFLRDYAPDLAKWQRDIISMMREEMLYFVPQMRTKIINEGWACATGDSLLATEQGFLRFDELVENRRCLNVASGETEQTHAVTDYHIERSVPTIRITTRRGYTIEGAERHRVQLADGSWHYLESLKQGDHIQLAHGTNVWATKNFTIPYTPSPRNATLNDVAEKVGVSVWTVLRHCAGRRTEKAEAITTALAELNYVPGRTGRTLATRHGLTVPKTLTPDLAYLLGYFVGDGNLTKSGICLTCGDAAHSAFLRDQVEAIFGIVPTLRDDRQVTGERWRVEIHSRELLQLLTDLGINLKARAREKAVPISILQSPKSVISAFLRGLFDADGYAGKAGVILSTSSKKMAQTVQILLLNYGILSTQRKQAKDIINLEIRGKSVQVFQQEISFEIEAKRFALQAKLDAQQWFKREEVSDEIVSIEIGENDVYDITVDVAHAYVANGLIHHNSYWHEKILTSLDLTPEEHLEFRKLHSSVLSPGSKMSINPYYVGYNILRDIEKRWNGEGDPDYPEDDWQGHALKRPTGEGLQKIFDVRRDESDISFLRKYLTKGLVEQLDMYTYRLEEVHGEQMWVVQDTDWRKVRDSMIDGMTNFGIPVIMVEDGDYKRRGELLLSHAYDGKALDQEYTSRTLKYIQFLWNRPVHIRTQKDDETLLFSHDGENFSVATEK